MQTRAKLSWKQILSERIVLPSASGTALRYTLSSVWLTLCGLLLLLFTRHNIHCSIRIVVLSMQAYRDCRARRGVKEILALLAQVVYPE